MIVRNGSSVIDYGPTPAPVHARSKVGGVLVVPESVYAAQRRAMAEYRAREKAKREAAR